ncbi:MAG: CoA transferase subunit A [Dehalococcoidia bacterium]
MKNERYLTNKFFDNATVMIASFAGPGGYPIKLVKLLAASKVKNLTIIANSAGGDGMVTPFDDHDILFRNHQVKKVICSFPAPINKDTEAKRQIAAGEVELEIIPQGNLAERIRAGGCGIPAFYSPVGIGTPFKCDNELREFNSKKYMLQTAIRGDFSLIRAHKADAAHNLIYKGSNRHFNPIMATASEYVMAEVDEIVDVLDPNLVVTCGIFINEVILSG